MRILAILLYIQSVMISGCHSGQNLESSSDQIPVVIHNGEKASLNETQIQNLTEIVNSLFSDCDDFYELLITNDFIESLKKEEQYLEIVFPEKQTLNLGKFGDQEIMRILIPLSGKYASADQVTFFYGISDYSNTPLSNSKGSAKLIATLGEIIP